MSYNPFFHFAAQNYKASFDGQATNPSGLSVQHYPASCFYYITPCHQNSQIITLKNGVLFGNRIFYMTSNGLYQTLSVGYPCGQIASLASHWPSHCPFTPQNAEMYSINVISKSTELIANTNLHERNFENEKRHIPSAEEEIKSKVCKKQQGQDFLEHSHKEFSPYIILPAESDIKILDLPNLDDVSNYQEKEISKSSQLMNENRLESGQHTPYNLNVVKDVLFRYFYAETHPTEKSEYLNDFEFEILKIMMIKKLVHDKNKSKVYHRIQTLKFYDLDEFLELNPAINRKNIIKSNIFKRVWKVLEKRRKETFNDYYFFNVSKGDSSKRVSIKQYRKVHSFKLSDEFYKKCFLSKRFTDDFFSVLTDKSFRKSILKNSQTKFLRSVHFWFTDIIIFLQKGQNPYDRKTKLPNFKFGLSYKDFELSPSLFRKLTRAE
jgi:hypothetical protein